MYAVSTEGAPSLRFLQELALSEAEGVGGDAAGSAGFTHENASERTMGDDRLGSSVALCADCLPPFRKERERVGHPLQ